MGLAAARDRLNIADDYFLAGRQLPWYAVATSLAGPGLGLESLLGMAGLAYLAGMAPAALCWGNFLAYSVLLWVVLPYLVRKKLSSMGELFERRYNRSARAVYAAVMLAFMIFGVLAPALAAGGWAVCEGGLGRTPEDAAWVFVACMAVVARRPASTAFTAACGHHPRRHAAIAGRAGRRGAAGRRGQPRRRAAWTPWSRRTSPPIPGRMGLFLPAGQADLPWIGVLMYWFTLSLGYAGGDAVERRSGAWGRGASGTPRWASSAPGCCRCCCRPCWCCRGWWPSPGWVPHDISMVTPDRAYLRLIDAVFSAKGFGGRWPGAWRFRPWWRPR